MSDKTRKNKIRRSYRYLGLAPFEDKIRENCVRWLGHIYKRPELAAVGETTVSGQPLNEKGWPKETWLETMMDDLEIHNLTGARNGDWGFM